MINEPRIDDVYDDQWSDEDDVEFHNEDDFYESSGLTYGEMDCIADVIGNEGRLSSMSYGDTGIFVLSEGDPENDASHFQSIFPYHHVSIECMADGDHFIRIYG